MQENTVAKILRIIGIVEVVGGLLLGIVAVDNSTILGVGIMLGAFVICMMFIGFSEIIKHLDYSTQIQIKILKKLEAEPEDLTPFFNKEEIPASAVIPDINKVRINKTENIPPVAQALKITENQVKCTYCGVIQKANRSHCYNCGTKFGQPEGTSN